MLLRPSRHRRHSGRRPGHDPGSSHGLRTDLRPDFLSDPSLHQPAYLVIVMPAESANPVLRFEHVNVSFDDVQALKDVSFELGPGETRIILGAAGSGKTVLLKTALGLVRPDSGSVYVFGQDITRMTEHQLFDIRSKLGMLFQESALFDSMTIQENVAYPLLNQKAIQCPPEEVPRRVRQALHFVELDQTLARFPSELSGGM